MHWSGSARSNFETWREKNYLNTKYTNPFNVFFAGRMEEFLLHIIVETFPHIWLLFSYSLMKTEYKRLANVLTIFFRKSLQLVIQLSWMLHYCR